MKMKEVTCYICGQLFLKQKGDISTAIRRGQSKFYCSKICFDSRIKKPKDIILECYICNKIFSKPINDYKKSLRMDKAIFVCSHSCANKPPRKRMTPKGLCYDCGNPCGSKQNRSKVRCNLCKNRRKQDSKNQFLVLENTMLQDVQSTIQKTYNFKNIYAIHRKIREHSRFIFQTSGKPKICAKCGYSLHVEISHIIPVKKFKETDTLGVINNIDNLIALCKNCHWEFDHNIFSIDGL